MYKSPNYRHKSLLSIKKNKVISSNGIITNRKIKYKIINKSPNVDVIGKLNRFVISKFTPHIAMTGTTKKTNNLVIQETDQLLSEYIRNKNLSVNWFRILFFQILSLLTVIKTKYKNFNHENLTVQSFYITTFDQCEKFKHNINSCDYVYESLGFDILLKDFECVTFDKHCNMYKMIRNLFVNNCFRNFLLDLKNLNIKIPKTIHNFIDRTFMIYNTNYEFIIQNDPLFREFVISSDIYTINLSKSNENDCNICYDPLSTDNKIIYELPCKHIYHKDCLFEWQQTSKQHNCPYCNCRILKINNLKKQ